MVGLKVRDTQGPFAKAPYLGGVSKIGILNVNQGMLRTKVLREVGFFSLDFRDYGIDPDLTAKVLLAGHDVVYTRPIAIHHHRLWPEDEGSAEHDALMRRHQHFYDLYAQKYGWVDHFAWTWRAKKALWFLGRYLMPSRMSVNSSEPFLHHLPRDWHNVLVARFISAGELLRSHDNKYHLRQRCPPWLQATNAKQPLRNHVSEAKIQQQAPDS
jgi:hypothetical protein